VYVFLNGNIVGGATSERRIVNMLARLHTALVNPLSLLRNEEGVTAIEYGLIAGLIAVVIITVVTSTGVNLTAKFQAVSDALK
jgi:pilus assembly protein Flp/PilA